MAKLPLLDSLGFSLGGLAAMLLFTRPLKLQRIVAAARVGGPER